MKGVRAKTTDVAREGTCSKELVLDKCFDELESTGQVVWFHVVEGNAELVFEMHVKGDVVSEISTHAGGVDDDGNVVFFEERCRTDTREHEDLGSMNCSAAEED